ncbi:hypothetical protein BC938DRAFT_481806 [Jimgerdemannia flammicorona]|uniref:Uncharacterized protein n=1 Tax=Jimgerdemannia flammicorona TaxID=994334 RepID=A0A433QFG8_9FUNG|nr:hypothetical protein BC938DRAFT_481806 [Jimgerdemannia flammicorona]
MVRKFLSRRSFPDQFRPVPFVILYLVGTGSEAGLVRQSLPCTKEKSTGYYHFLIAIIAIYLPSKCLLVVVA